MTFRNCQKDAWPWMFMICKLWFYKNGQINIKHLQLDTLPLKCEKKLRIFSPMRYKSFIYLSGMFLCWFFSKICHRKQIVKTYFNLFLLPIEIAVPKNFIYTYIYIKEHSSLALLTFQIILGVVYDYLVLVKKKSFNVFSSWKTYFFYL